MLPSDCVALALAWRRHLRGNGGAHGARHVEPGRGYQAECWNGFLNAAG